MTITLVPSDKFRIKPDDPAARRWLGVVALIAAMTLMRVLYASLLDLRTDEAYYWTWSKESALSFLDHPPMIVFRALLPAIFGDTVSA